MSAPINSKINLQPVRVALDRIPKDFEKFKQSCLRDLQRLLLVNTQSHAPRNTGKYASSWKLGTIQGNKATIETPNGKLYTILEFTGARPGVRRPKNAKAIRFEDGNGNVIFTMRVDFPGFKAIPHTRPAIRETLQKATTIIYGNLGETYPIWKQATQSQQSELKQVRVKRVIQKKTGRKRFRRRGTIRSKSVTG